ncbi:ABC transporter permease [Streptomyces chartreusis]|uniref:ABC transporter permease n=1 Tax=Streptomyces chartreusis TaxID=1969 RepID=UPI00341035F7
MHTSLTRLRAAFTPLRYGAVVYLLVLIIAALAAPATGHDPLSQDIAGSMADPGTNGHLLGTDQLGRDTLTRILYGARTELVIAIGATAFAAMLGTLPGLLGGYFRRYVEFITMRIVGDVLLAFPPIVLALLIVSIYGPGTLTLIVVMGILFSPTFARLSYGQTLTVKNAEYVDAARAYGASTPRTLFGVVLPNILAPLIVQFSLVMAASILLESGLSYLGLGVVPPAPSWGSMIADGQRYMANDLNLILIPSIFIVLTILSFSLIGDTLRDWLDPRGRRRSNA